MRVVLFIISLFMLTVQNAYNQPKVELAMKDEVVKKLSPILTQELQKSNLLLGNEIFIRVLKKTEKYPNYGELEIWMKPEKTSVFHFFKSYPICYYSGGLGFKTKEGDKKTPEGVYSVIPANLNHFSNYHRGFDIGYPNLFDRQKHYTGSAIMVHGDCVSIGCIAMTDTLIEEIWTLVVCAFHAGQKQIPIHIFPFPVTETNLQKYSDEKYNSFWLKLKILFDYFEENKQILKDFKY